MFNVGPLEVLLGLALILGVRFLVRAAIRSYRQRRNQEIAAAVKAELTQQSRF